MKQISKWYATETSYQSRPILHIASLTMTLFLAGCSFGHLKPSSVLRDPNHLQTSKTFGDVKVSDAAWPTQQWWRGFKDPQLDLLVAQALSDSPTIRAAAARVRQAQAFQGLAAGGLQPQVSANVSSYRQRYSENGTTPAVMAGTWQYVNQDTLNFAYELDFWGKNRATLDSAIGQRKAAEVDSYAARLMLSSAIVQTYIELMSVYEQRDVQQQLLKQQEKILELTHRRFQAELDSNIDMKQVEALIPVTRSHIALLNQSIELHQNHLAALLGKGPDAIRDLKRPHMSLPEQVALPSQLPLELLGRRPDIVAQRWRVEAASQDIHVAKARFYPNISLTAYAGTQSLSFDLLTQASSRILSIGPALSLPIFEGGKLRANLAVKDATYDLAVENYNQALADGLRDISDQLTSLRWLAVRFTEQQQAVTTANDALILVMHRYKAGLSNYIEVLFAQNNLLTQKVQLVQLQSENLALHAQLSRALGGGYMPDVPLNQIALEKKS